MKKFVSFCREISFWQRVLMLLMLRIFGPNFATLQLIETWREPNRQMKSIITPSNFVKRFYQISQSQFGAMTWESSKLTEKKLADISHSFVIKIFAPNSGAENSWSFIWARFLFISYLRNTRMKVFRRKANLLGRCFWTIRGDPKLGKKQIMKFLTNPPFGGCESCFIYHVLSCKRERWENV